MGLFFNNQDIENAGVTEKAVLYSHSRFSWGLSEIGAAKPDGARLLREAPAAFRRLCVETSTSSFSHRVPIQPPLGGCVLKLCQKIQAGFVQCQPPLGGCVLKLLCGCGQRHGHDQPPLGGCVLKLLFVVHLRLFEPPSRL